MKRTILVCVPNEKLDLQLKRVCITAPRHDLFAWHEQGEDALDYAKRNPVDLFIVQPAMPYSEFSVYVKAFREVSGAPILGLFESEDVDSLAFGLGLVDDGMLLPFRNETEFVARSLALLNRPGHSAQKIVKQGMLRHVRHLVFYKDARRIFVNDNETHLTKTEFDILDFLLLNIDIAITRDQIYSEVWDDDTATDIDDTVRGHVKELRKKIKAHSDDIIIETVHGIGYRISSSFLGQLAFSKPSTA